MQLLHSARTALVSTLRPWVRDTAAELLQRSSLLAPTRLARDKFTIVTFHRVLPAAALATYPMPGIAVTPEELDWLLDLFGKYYSPGTLAEMATRFALGDRPNKPLLAVTFDDGQRDNYDHAKDVLAAHGIHASFYVVANATEHDQTLWHDRLAYGLRAALAREPTRAEALLAPLDLPAANGDIVHAVVSRAKRMTPLERERFVGELEQAAGDNPRPSWDGMMSWDQLKQLHAAGHEIGSHSRSHPILPLVSDAQLVDEIAGSRAQLRERLGFEIESFCYPNGDCDRRVTAAVEQAGYRHAVTTRYGLNSADASHFLWKRCDMQSSHARTRLGEFSEGRMLLRLSGLLPTSG